jgi:NADPH-dependent 2,4-dienoyl-CoA reductase/sulfur reductase-like enzyme
MSISDRPLIPESQPSQTRFDRGEEMEGQKRKKVLVVGAGAAGMLFPLLSSYTKMAN